MYVGSQIQDTGNRGDVTSVDDKREKFKYSYLKCHVCNRQFKLEKYYNNHIKQCDAQENECKYCGKIFKKLRTFNYHKNFCGDFRCNNCNAKYRVKKCFNDHIVKCIKNYPPQKEGVAYVKCRICNFNIQNLTQHLKIQHDMSAENYMSQFEGAKVICDITHENYVERNKYNGNWIARKNEAGEDLTEYKQKMGNSVRDAIMSNPEERKRRSELAKDVLGEYAKSPRGRKNSSKAAKKTSKRPEIIEARSKQLQNWRDNNRDEFHEKCIKPMINSLKHNSKPENALFQIVKSYNDTFKHSQFLIDQMFRTKSKRKQVDIYSKELGIVIEFDGIFHFDDVYQNNQLLETQKRDQSLNNYCLKNNLTLIRVSYDQHIGKDDEIFKKECLNEIFDIIDEKRRGNFFIGEKYDK